QADPKPLYYRPEFLNAAVKDYLEVRGLEYVAEIDPDDFTRWVFPRLFHSRVPRYEAIARPHGYTVSSNEVAQVRNERDFLQLLEQAIARKSQPRV
ncbi:MAG: ATPase, partial [Pseudomonadota bacterium]|nr:ATPase [Pseudomonadota bacterium]